jgi:hypothetical protein
LVTVTTKGDANTAPDVVVWPLPEVLEIDVGVLALITFSTKSTAAAVSGFFAARIKAVPKAPPDFRVALK